VAPGILGAALVLSDPWIGRCEKAFDRWIAPMP
jgi:hypothetical protein